MKAKYIYFILAMMISVSFAAGGCGSGGGGSSQKVDVNPNPVIPAPDLTQSKLNSGKLITGTPKADCDDSFVLDAVNELCKIFKLLKGDGSDACINQTSSCNSYERQLYTGSTLGPGPKGAKWNGRGGSGALMADAAVCTLRELSPKVPGGGPVHSSTSLDIGIGDVVVKQEVGYLDFDRTLGRFKGYRKLRIELPVIGKFNAVSQNIDLRRIFYSTGQVFNEIPKAGDYPLLFAYGLNLSTEEKNKSIDIDPGSFDVKTPIGIFQVSPHFEYKSNTVVADMPFVTDHTYIILPDDDFDNTPAAIRLSDIYGLIPGINNNATPLPGNSNYKDLRTGWVSQIGLGARGSIDDNLWSPPGSVFFSRPDYDPTGVLLFEKYDSRSEEENRPSVYASASASVKYPKNPGDMLPDWVDGLPGLDWDAYIQVTPTIKAGAAGQFGVSLSEGTDNKHDLKEFGAHADSRIAALGIYSGVEANASFEVLAELRLYVSAVFDFFVGSKRIDLIDIHPKFPIPIAGGTPTSSKVELAAAYSTSDSIADIPETLDYLKTFKGAKNPEEFINLCYAKVTEVPPEEPPCTKEEDMNLPECKTEKGDVTDLFEYLPCNICLATDAVIDSQTGAVKQEAHKDVVFPVNPIPPLDSTTPAVWKCDAASKSGCMDLCKLNKETGEFSVVKNPSQIADSMPTTDPDYNKLYPFYKSCMITCTEPPVGGILDISCGKGLDSTPPGTFGIMVPGGGGGAPAPVPVDTNLAAPFTEPVDPVSVNTSTFTVTDADGNLIDGSVSYDASTYTALFTPSRNFDHNTTYRATITTGITDLSGNPLPADYSWSFTTEAFPDTESPTVIATSPVSDAVDVDINSKLRAKFSEAMDETSIHTGTVTVNNGVTGTVAYDSTTMTAIFTPSVPLANETMYTVTISTGVKDLSGNSLANNYTWSFQTAATQDVTAPAVNSTNPASDATAVPLDAMVSVTFTEPVDIGTVTASTFTLSSGRAGNVPGTFFFADGGATATFIPSAELNAGDTYATTITTEVQDLAGNPMAGDYSWNFTTVSAPKRFCHLCAGKWKS